MEISIQSKRKGDSRCSRYTDGIDTTADPLEEELYPEPSGNWWHILAKAILRCLPLLSRVGSETIETLNCSEDSPTCIVRWYSNSYVLYFRFNVHRNALWYRYQATEPRLSSVVVPAVVYLLIHVHIQLANILCSYND